MQEELKFYLENSNWKEEDTFQPVFPETEKKFFIKAIDHLTGVPCQLNLKAPNLGLNYSCLIIHGKETEFLTVSIKGQVRNLWYNLEAYSLSPEEFMRNELRLTDKLIASWEALQNS